MVDCRASERAQKDLDRRSRPPNHLSISYNFTTKFTLFCHGGPAHHYPRGSLVGRRPLPGTVAQTDRVYQFTCHKNTQPTWGSYCTRASILQELSSSQPPLLQNEEEKEETVDTLALSVATAFWKAASSLSPSSTQNCQQQRQQSSIFDTALQHAHGVAVWALRSSIDSSVPYHLDCAEYIRYTTNQMVVPVLAATWHCTRNETRKLEGGDFFIHTDGLNHYARHGYKACLRPIVRAVIDEKESEGFVKYSYHFNRLIVQSGHLPHLSTTVTCLDETKQRVVVGFNVFLDDFGSQIARFPEHSQAFRDEIQRLRSQRASTVSIATIRHHPKLRRLLVLAKRQQVKNDLLKQQRLWNDQMVKHLQCHAPCSVQSLLDQLLLLSSSSDDNQTRNDLHVHIHHAIGKGVLLLQPHVSSSASSKEKRHDLVALDTIVTLPPLLSLKADSCIQ